MMSLFSNFQLKAKEEQVKREKAKECSQKIAFLENMARISCRAGVGSQNGDSKMQCYTDSIELREAILSCQEQQTSKDILEIPPQAIFLHRPGGK